VVIDSFPYSQVDLDKFRQVQRLAYDMASEVESRLEAGMSEADVCELLADAHERARVTQVFHQPFAWFGERTMLGPDWAPDVGNAVELSLAGEMTMGGFFPTDQQLAPGMALIVDLAPVLDGYSSDIGYSCVFGSNVVFDELDAGLAEIRPFLIEGVRAGRTLQSLYRALDAMLTERGWENCHQYYPDRALGHLVFRLDPDPDRTTPIPGFGTAAAEGLLAAGLSALENQSCYPVWNDSEFTDFPASPGVWAVEPHIGRNGLGAKFEELLVVTEDDAYWLDDHLAHTERWASSELTDARSPS